MNRFETIVGAIALGMTVLAAAAQGAPREDVIVVANRAVPESVELARYYMRARKIADANLCVLDLPKDDVIGRKLYTIKLRDPLLAFLRDGGFIMQVPRDPDEIRPEESEWKTIHSSVRYLVCLYGVPWRIADSSWSLLNRVFGSMEPEKRTDAAVDSELALSLYSGYRLEGPLLNPAYNVFSFDELARSGNFLLLATRLDGPDPATVRRMIDTAIEAEQYGLQGRGYFDARQIDRNAYRAGDYWIKGACERFRNEGYECALDEGEPVWGPAFPMEDAAVYMGWYQADVAGPFQREGFRFMPGALAYHLHSGSASDLRSTTKSWVGPLLWKGAAVSMGAVSEPYLSYTPQLDVFAGRLCDGYSFGESAYMSLTVLSWQITLVGDPLYTPFRWSLDEQIRRMEKDRRPEVAWAYVRKINKLAREGRFNVALAYCRDKLAAHPGPVLREKLGDLYARNDLYEDAGRAYEQVLEDATTPETAVRVGARWILILRLLKQSEKAARVEAELRSKWPDHPLLMWLETAKP